MKSRLLVVRTSSVIGAMFLLLVGCTQKGGEQMETIHTLSFVNSLSPNENVYDIRGWYVADDPREITDATSHHVDFRAEKNTMRDFVSSGNAGLYEIILRARRDSTVHSLWKTIRVFTELAKEVGLQSGRMKFTVVVD